MLRKRVWLNTPWGNYSDKKKHLLSNEEIEQYKMYEENNIAFAFGDFVNSGCVTKPTLSILNKQPNYMILYDGNEIEARYFVTSFTYVAGEPKNENAGTYEATLVRDLIIDYKDDIKNNLFKCERGYLDRNTWSPILVQPEGLSLNRIKKAQIPIKLWDDNAQWLTIFYDTGRDGDIKLEFDQTNLMTAGKTQEEMNNIYISKGFQAPDFESDSQIYDRKGVNIKFTATFMAKIGGVLHDNSYITCTMGFDREGPIIHEIEHFEDPQNPLENVRNDLNKFLSDNYSAIWQKQSELYNIDKTNGYTDIRNTYDNTLVQGTELKRMHVSSDQVINQNPIDTSNSLYQFINNIFKFTPNRTDAANINVNGHGYIFWVSSPRPLNMAIFLDTHSMITNFTTASVSAQLMLPATKVSPRLDDTYLGCVTIPFGENVKVKNGNNIYEMNRQLIKSLATEGWAGTGTLIKDIQILPYCPCNKLNQEYNNNNPNSIIDATFLSDLYRVPIKLVSDSSILYYGFVCDQSSMNYRYPIDLSSYFGDDIKMDSITKSIRLCSHNHKQSFEMNPTLNNGVDSLSFECTLRPNNTVYHICPIFKELYGGNYEDVRGLVWEGGFSLPFVSNAFTEYRLQNSTYKELFDRDVKNLEINTNTARGLEELEMGRRAVNGIIGSITGASAITSVTASNMNRYDEARKEYEFAKHNTPADLWGYGNPEVTSAKRNLTSAKSGIIGTAVAAVGGLIGSVVNIGMDFKALSIHNKQRAEDLSYKKDTWNLQMQAIQARPNTVATSTEYSILNYYKAYIEIYDCTEIEKEFINKALSYKSMKIGQIGYINDFVINDNCYVEGNLIFMQGQTPLITNAVNEELKSGIYVQEGLFN